MKLLLIGLAVSTLALSGCETYDSGRDSRYNSSYGNNNYSNEQNRNRQCQDCGVVVRIDRQGGSRSTGGGGAVLGAVVGGVLGNQIGSGDGRTVATVAGAVAGGVAGNSIERRMDDGDYAVIVRLDRGGEARLVQRDLNGVREGSRVQIRNGRAWLD